MTMHDRRRTLVPAKLACLALGAAVTAGAAFAATPAFADSSSSAHAGTVSVHAQPANARAHAVNARPQVVNKPAQRPATVARPATADTLLKIAKSQIGVTENAEGGGTPFQHWYMSSPRAAETAARDGGTIASYANAPWCAMFVSWVGEQAGMRSTVGWDAYTITYAKWFQANKHWGDTPKPGAVVFFSWHGKSVDSIDHVGIVEKDNGDGTISTVEGNTGNGKVEQRVRPTSQVVGYGYPAYQG
ncbi:CHAP domain-containing protein [Nonomuraea pusilla]|uniref:CHAP domain-containing protein n=1 Tax=Nonomuraea pusilla TaxID=46177 RepID=UPI003331E988